MKWSPGTIVTDLHNLGIIMSDTEAPTVMWDLPQGWCTVRHLLGTVVLPAEGYNIPDHVLTKAAEIALVGP